MIDSHCHIGFDDQDTGGIISRAQGVGITHMLTVACAKNDYSQLLRLLDKYPNLYGAFGIHPENADDCPSADEFIQMLSAHPRIVGVGECGLDYHYSPETKESQIKAFQFQIELAHHLHKPIIIHTREADDDTISLLDTAYHKGLLSNGGVLHCFSSGLALAQKGLQCGLYLSVSGMITFKSADMIRDIFKMVPLNRMLIETDSPYLAPVPYRGRDNEPAFMIKTAEKLAEIKGVSLSEIDKITTENFYRLFQIQEVPYES